MPGPGVVLVGPATVAATVHAAKHVAAHAYMYSPEIGTFSSATLAAVLARMAWKSVPEWIKEDVSFRNLVGKSESNNNQEGDNNKSREELTHMASVIEKLQALAKVGSSKLESPVPQLHAALLAYVQLSAQLKSRQQQRIFTTGRISRQESNRKRVKEEEEEENKNGDEDDQNNNKNNDDEDNDDDCNSSNGMDETTAFTRDYLYETAGESCSPKELQSNNELKDALIYATWAYYQDSETLQSNLEEYDFFLLDHSLAASRPGYLSYYIAVSPERKQLIVGIKGTTSLEDLLTDCCGRAVPFVDHSTATSTLSSTRTMSRTMTDLNSMSGNGDLEDKSRIEVCAAQPNEIRTNAETGEVEIISGHERIYIEDHDEEGDHYVRCHEGILVSSQRLADKIQDKVEQLVLGNSQYRLLLCGHSLGAGAASVLALILRSRFPELALLQQEQTNKDVMHVYAFAPPPVLDHDAALAASSYCTSIVNNADIIPRSSLANLLVFLEFLRSIHIKLQEKNMNPTGPFTTAAFLQKISQGIKGELLMTAEEVQRAMDAAHDKIELRNPDHLYPPGKVYLAYKPWNIKVCEEEAEEKKETWDSSSTQEEQKLMENNDDNHDDDYVILGNPPNPYEIAVTDGTATALRFFEIDGTNMFTNHVTSSYYEILGLDYNY